MARILFAYDGSPEARRSLRYAARLGEGDTVAVISVLPVLIASEPPLNVNEFIVNHRKGVGKPVISTEGFSRFPCTLLVARCHSPEFQAGKTVDRRNVRYLRPAFFRVCTDDSDTDFFLNHVIPFIPCVNQL